MTNWHWWKQGFLARCEKLRNSWRHGNNGISPIALNYHLTKTCYQMQLQSFCWTKLSIPKPSLMSCESKQTDNMNKLVENNYSEKVSELPWTRNVLIASEGSNPRVLSCKWAWKLRSHTPHTTWQQYTNGSFNYQLNIYETFYWAFKKYLNCLSLFILLSTYLDFETGTIHFVTTFKV